jgi:hypothetical protein
MAMTSTERARKRRHLMTASERTAANTYYAVKRRHDLVRVLSPELRCSICGEVHRIAQLDIDHQDGRLWRVEKVSPSARAARYWREHEAGVRLRVLCHSCGGRDGGRRRYDVARD